MARVRYFIMLAAGVAVVLAACSGEDSPPSATVAVTPGPSATASVQPQPTTTPRESTVTTGDFVPDYAALVATIESEMEGTAYEGAALEDPEAFIATAELFCDLLEEGMTTDELLAEYLDRLSDGGAVEVDEDDGLMAGVLLGASVEIVCPQESEDVP